MIKPGCMAEFESEDALLEAIAAVRAEDYTQLDAFTPFPVEGLSKALGLRRSWLNWLVFLIAISGAGIGYLIQWYVNTVNYPLNVGGRPPAGWPTYIPITFETAVLFSGVGAFLLFFLLARLPRLWHPVFDVPGFTSVTNDRFWLGVDERDPLFHPTRTPALLASLGASRVSVPAPPEEHA
jgi:hypothetical protein